ncbi:P22 coat - protein 5 family protein, partial [Neisseria elongata]
RGLNTGPGYLSVQADMFAQGLRGLVNLIEIDIATEAYLNASRAFGSAATPFQTNMGETAQIKKILDDNGAPGSDRSLIIDTSAGAALRTLSNLTRVNEAGTTMTLRDGELLNLNGLSLKESAGVRSPVVGTMAGSTTNTTGYAVGARVITLAAAGTGSILAGDVITFAGDANKYVVAIG